MVRNNQRGQICVRHVETRRFGYILRVIGQITSVVGGVVLHLGHRLHHSVHAAAPPLEEQVRRSGRHTHPRGGRFRPLLRNVACPPMDDHHWKHVRHLGGKRVRGGHRSTCN